MLLVASLRIAPVCKPPEGTLEKPFSGNRFHGICFEETVSFETCTQKERISISFVMDSYHDDVVILLW